jgi:hypothetical protein
MTDVDAIKLSDLKMQIAHGAIICETDSFIATVATVERAWIEGHRPHALDKPVIVLTFK